MISIYCRGLECVEIFPIVHHSSSWRGAELCIGPSSQRQYLTALATNTSCSTFLFPFATFNGYRPSYEKMEFWGRCLRHKHQIVVKTIIRLNCKQFHMPSRTSVTANDRGISSNSVQRKGCKWACSHIRCLLYRTMWKKSRALDTVATGSDISAQIASWFQPFTISLHFFDSFSRSSINYNYLCQIPIKQIHQYGVKSGVIIHR